MTPGSSTRVASPPTRQLTGEVKRELEYQRHEFAIDCDPGMIAPDFDHDEIDMLFLEKSRDFIKEHVKTSSDKPFFLYHAMQAVHLPSFPADQFMGKSGETRPGHTDLVKFHKSQDHVDIRGGARP